MKSVEKFTVEIRSGFDQWWRYNAALMCGAFDASGNRIGFASAESRVAEMGSNLEAPPEGLDLHRSLTEGRVYPPGGHGPASTSPYSLWHKAVQWQPPYLSR